MTDQAQVNQDPTAEARKKRAKGFRKHIDNCKNHKRKLIQHWAVNVDYRRGKPYATQSDEDRVAVPLDWTLTELKQAMLFSQVPAVRINHPPQTTDPNIKWLHPFEQRVNDTLLEAGIESAMDEVMPDCINAAGFGVVMVSYESITQPVEVPSIDLAAFPPQVAQQIQQSGMMPNGTPVPMTTVPKVVDKRYVIERVSPGDLLWPIGFSRSNFDTAPWLGRTGKTTWAIAQQRWGLDPKDKSKYVGSVAQIPQDLISSDLDKDKDDEEELVGFDEIFYLDYAYNAECRDFKTINHLVFLHGHEGEPVVDEPWKGQKIDDKSGEVFGAQKFPIRVLTLTYVTDEAIPPSDTSVGRSQVNEINKSRSQMIKQRERSIPIRTFDVNRVDPAIQYALMRGEWQHMIPVQGVGTNIITEVTRSSFPNENFRFDSIAKADLFEIWMVGQGQSGVDVETAKEAGAIAANSNTRISRARAKVGKFFVGIAEVLGGLLSIYEEEQSFGQGFSSSISKTLAYSILADSTVLLDSNQRLQRLMQFVNFTAKSGRVDIESVLREIATLSGLDPNVVIIKPAPKPPVEPNISLRLTGTEDMLNPMTLAFLIKSGQAPQLQDIEKAKQMIQVAVQPPVVQVGPNGQPLPPPGPPGNPLPPPPAIGEAEPQWGAMNRINQRVVERDGDGQRDNNG